MEPFKPPRQHAVFFATIHEHQGIMSNLSRRSFITGGAVAALGGTLALAGCEWLCALRGKGGGATAPEFAGLAPLVKTDEF
ncbi:hypothetical protein DMP08_00495 [Paraeggerthella hongkongensis]|uniref:Uncharacterized protein n=1 Tax=Paraeggerthella hongkongensis TaxID=230658 RepID=A0A3N0BLV8_9ACTN|nr:hypothetical protein DMP08_00495 [Paraeggerthella hongkongensis]